MDVKIKDIKIKHLSKNNTKAFEIYANIIPANNIICGKEVNFMELTFDEVSVIKRLLTRNTDESLKMIIKIFTDEKIENVFYYELISFIKWLTKTIIEFQTKENELSVTDSKMLSAGIERLNMFGELNTKIQLAEQFGKLPSDIGKMTYVQVLQIMSYNSVKHQIQKELNK
jgi:hypothetical protein